MHVYTIHYNNPFEQTEITFFRALKQLKVAQILRQTGIRKSLGHSAYRVFLSLLLLAFQGKNLYRYLNYDHTAESMDKNTYYRFLNESTYNWRRFLLTLSAEVVTSFKRLTAPDRVNVLILDDSVVSRNRSNKVELLARIFDHSICSYLKGFTLLSLGWSDGYSFGPTDFAMLSSRKEANRFQEISNDVDKRISGGKHRKEALIKKTDTAIGLIRYTLKQGITADYVLMVSCFTHEPMIKNILAEGLDVVGMVKDNKQKYSYNGKFFTLKELRKLIPSKGIKNILGHVTLENKSGIPVRLTYVKNRSSKRDWLVILSTDLSLTSEEVVRIY